MPIQIIQRREDEVPTPSAFGRVNEDTENIKAAMRLLGPGMVLEIDAGSETAVRGTKLLITKAGNQLGTKWQHWSSGSKVFAKPAGEAPRRRGRRPKAQS